VAEQLSGAMTVLHLADVAVRPEPGDNVAIVTRDLARGTQLRVGDTDVVLPHRVLEGHRIAVDRVAAGEPLLSWSTPFATAEASLRPGDYVCTSTSLAALRERGVDDLPDTPTAENVPLDPYRLDESVLHVGEQVDPVTQPRSFLGYPRAHGPVGTRNHVVVVGVTARSAAFVESLAHRLERAPFGGFDGVVPVAHTEAGEDRRPNNVTFVLSVLAGFLVHPNVGAVLVVDEPDAVITTADVLAFMREEGYPDISVPHAFFTRTASFADDLARAARTVAPWIAGLAAQERTQRPLSELKIALQCGGSDAFSGITANPLAGAVAAEVIRHGGSAVLAETDELIGAEGYLLKNVRSAEVARRFLAAVESFKERVGWHGHTAEGNPSGGNVHRGLYNIVLKSVGAARKLDPHVRLDHVVEYGRLLPDPGFTFMDSPGNDLESIAGEVAAGCNLIFFTTGSGSITNFPFVPTLKFVTTSARYRVLAHEMDVDAGRYLSGVAMADLAAETFELTVRTASGERSAGERAGHSQVSIWREWRQTGPRAGISLSIDGRTAVRVEGLATEERDVELDGLPLPVSVSPMPSDLGTGTVPMYGAGDGRRSPEQVALLLPTSLCSGQVALRLAHRVSREGWHLGRATRTVALPHTEGCGVSGGSAIQTYTRLMTGYLVHPNVRMALLLEHGCEKTHNDYFQARLLELGIDPARFGWASIQRDGGIEHVAQRVRDWFADLAAVLPPPERTTGALGDLTLAMEARGPLPTETARAFANVGRRVVAAGGSVVLPSNGTLVGDTAFRDRALAGLSPVSPTLAHGQRPNAAGWHVMRMPTTDWTETTSGLGAGGAQIVLAHVTGGTLSGHRLVPVLQVTADPETLHRHGPDLDAVLEGDAPGQELRVLELIREVASGTHTARALNVGNVGFQVTRGLLGTSM
jgi:altronate dehydratase